MTGYALGPSEPRFSNESDQYRTAPHVAPCSRRSWPCGPRSNGWPKKKRIRCKSNDPTSGIKSCKIKGYSKKAGKHKLKATAVNGAGLSSKATLKYRVTGGKGK